MQARELASRAQLVATSGGSHGGSRDVEAVTELRRDCQNIRTEIQQVGLRVLHTGLTLPSSAVETRVHAAISPTCSLT